MGLRADAVESYPKWEATGSTMQKGTPASPAIGVWKSVAKDETLSRRATGLHDQGSRTHAESASEMFKERSWGMEVAKPGTTWEDMGGYHAEAYVET